MRTIRAQPLSLLDLLKLNLSIHKKLHPLNLQILSKLHPLLLQFNHLPLFLPFHSLIYLSKPLNRPCQLLHPLHLPLLLSSSSTALLTRPQILLFLLRSPFLLSRGSCRSHRGIIPPKIRIIHRRGRPLLRQQDRLHHSNRHRFPIRQSNRQRRRRRGLLQTRSNQNIKPRKKRPRTRSWDHHDILSVLPECNSHSQCCANAILKSIAPYSGRKETAVYATDANSGMVIRCKVYIDNISRIQIFRDYIKLDIDELATLRVRAFDSEGNMFTSLVGVQFMWQLMPETDGLPHHLVHVPLKESPLSDCVGFCTDISFQTRLEDSGVFSDLYVVKGTKFGHGYVSVHLSEPTYDQIADKIVLTVAEAMSITPPSPVYVLIGALVQYNLRVVRGSFSQAVALPSLFHKWSGSNTSVSRVETLFGKASAMSLGVSTITVEDTRIPTHIQMSSLHVVLPDLLRLNILPLSLSGDLLEGVTGSPSISRWYVVSGRQYLIEMKVFAQGLAGAEEIYITENDNVKLHEDNSNHWDMFPVSNRIALNHDWWNPRILKAASYGLGNLTATVTYSNGRYERKEVIKVVQEVMVCDQVKFIVDRRSATGSILLLWGPAVYQEMELKATGGCATASWKYKWFSSNMAIASVSAYGIVQPKMPGKANIKVVSIFDPSNYDEIVIEVSTPSSFVMLQNFPVETVAGSNLRAFVTLTTSNGAYFYKCDFFSSSIRWKTESESLTIIDTTYESFVLDDHIYASSNGRPIFHASLERGYQTLDHLNASSAISPYVPLIVHQAGDGNRVGVSDGRGFESTSTQYIYMNIQVHIEDHFIELIDRSDGYVKAPSFTIQADHLGVTTLYLSARQQSGLEIRSQPIKVEVFGTYSNSIHPSANACVIPKDLFGKAQAIGESTLEAESFVNVPRKKDTFLDEEEEFREAFFFYFLLLNVFLIVVTIIAIVMYACYYKIGVAELLFGI